MLTVQEALARIQLDHWRENWFVRAFVEREKVVVVECRPYDADRVRRMMDAAYPGLVEVKGVYSV